jgi:hypothetical protein
MLRIREAVFSFTVATIALGAAGCSTTDAPAGPSNVVNVADPKATGITIGGASSLFQRGQTAQLTAVVTLSNGFTENRASAAQWQSSNSGAVSVNSSGVITAGNEGDATIRATYDGVAADYVVRVRYANRTPDPAPGQRLPVPNEAAYVASLINSRPDLLARSCQDEGGTWELMDFIVDRLRTEKDLRWGYNGRRGDVTFPARDEIAYHWGTGPDELSRDTYAFDIIGGHCGSNPVPTWIDQSALGTVWMSRGRF